MDNLLGQFITLSSDFKILAKSKSYYKKKMAKYKNLAVEAYKNGDKKQGDRFYAMHKSAEEYYNLDL